jgi:2-haloacid dehalogenase
MDAPIKVLAFDVFGTVVDWHGSVMREVQRMGLPVDADAFALAWREGYKPAMARVMSGEQGWMLIDNLHRMILDDVLMRFGVHALSEDGRRHLNRVWHRLDPWPDSSAGIRRLKSRFMVVSLSNGNLGLLANMAKHGDLAWDCILSAEVFRAYKPAPAVYEGAVRVFDVAPQEVLMVAAHQDDLAAARAAGLRTAYIERPFEFGRAHEKDVSPDPANLLHARDIVHLAELLDC